MPDITLMISEILVYLQANIKITIAIALVFIYLLLRKPRLLAFLLFLTLILGSIFYLISNVASTGTHYKKGMAKEHRMP